ncbi:hypothetical protein llap_9145 [Limosa lapponica baueri]|uniref:Uncharacterized protein n=1 Tax=Limosa lapponica baueri TaxID=1758121 RepID=A0A2I0U395_LIMLA|nr:hypothetical protein llap_9145 [Limosa lapponica baueri]
MALSTLQGQSWERRTHATLGNQQFFYGVLADIAQAGWASFIRRWDVWMLCPLEATVGHRRLHHLQGTGWVGGWVTEDPRPSWNFVTPLPGSTGHGMRRNHPGKEWCEAQACQLTEEWHGEEHMGDNLPQNDVDSMGEDPPQDEGELMEVDPPVTELIWHDPNMPGLSSMRPHNSCQRSAKPAPHQQPRDPFLQGCTPAFCPQSVRTSRITLSQVQNLAFVLVKSC